MNTCEINHKGQVHREATETPGCPQMDLIPLTTMVRNESRSAQRMATDVTARSD